MSILKKVFGSRNERVIRKMRKTVAKINELEPTLQRLSDTALAAKTDEFKQRLQDGAALDSLLVEAFAVVREASVRTLGMRHFDVQLIGGMVLHQGKIAEMRTGEGKTLMSTLPAYLNALTGKGVHVITVNDYLASRDAKWMEPIYQLLGLTVGVALNEMDHTEKQAAYAADITYGTNNEFGFDYLRDNMCFALEDKVQRPLSFAILDEVDSILIDEARTPLIISGAAEDSSALYKAVDKLIPGLVKREGTEEEGATGDYYLDEKAKQAFFTDEGHEKIENLLKEANLLKEDDNLYGAANIALMHHINAALRAHTLYHKDVDYIVKDNEILIVDEHTGRVMVGRRWSEGLHQAVEAKEKVAIQQENQTLASITFQNYFRMYDKLSGMTGTADTEAYEFQQIYHLEVVVIPTNKPMVRQDHPDLVYLKAVDKFKAVIEDIKYCRQHNRPILVGTASIDTSEFLSNLLKKENIEHQVLNAKKHDSEAIIIAEAGRPGVVTIATNMAGRGTDIVLGGSLDVELEKLSEHATDADKQRVKDEWQKNHDMVVDAGGLHIIGSERHESRRIDNQLRGRAGRQGDPGSSRFYLSLEDDLIRIFASERMANLMQRFGMQEGVALESSLLTKAIENAQRKVESRNFDIRKQLLEYDDVANEQRKAIYAQRNELLEQADLKDTVDAVLDDVLDVLFHQYIPPQSLEDLWDVPGLQQALKNEFALDLNLQDWLAQDKELHEENLKQKILNIAKQHYLEKENLTGRDVLAQFEKSIFLQSLDGHWREHLAAMDYLRQGIHFRGYAQQNPKQEYKRESFNLFSEMLDSYKHEVISILLTVQVQEEDVDSLEAQRRSAMPGQLQFEHADADTGIWMPEEGEVSTLNDYQQPEGIQTFVRDAPKVGRNDPCPCGSGKKYKQCHGKLGQTQGEGQSV